MEDNYQSLPLDGVLILPSVPDDVIPPIEVLLPNYILGMFSPTPYKDTSIPDYVVPAKDITDYFSPPGLSACEEENIRMQQECADYANKIKKEIYRMLFVPIMVYIAYNLYYLFFFKDCFDLLEKPDERRYENPDDQGQILYGHECTKCFTPIFPDWEMMFHKIEGGQTNFFFEFIFKPVKMAYTFLNAIKAFFRKFDFKDKYPYLFFLLTFNIIYNSYNFFERIIFKTFTTLLKFKIPDVQILGRNALDGYAKAITIIFFLFSFLKNFFGFSISEFILCMYNKYEEKRKEAEDAQPDVGIEQGIDMTPPTTEPLVGPENIDVEGAEGAEGAEGSIFDTFKESLSNFDFKEKWGELSNGLSDTFSNWSDTFNNWKDNTFNTPADATATTAVNTSVSPAADATATTADSSVPPPTGESGSGGGGPVTDPELLARFLARKKMTGGDGENGEKCNFKGESYENSWAKWIMTPGDGPFTKLLKIVCAIIYWILKFSISMNLVKLSKTIFTLYFLINGFLGIRNYTTPKQTAGYKIDVIHRIFYTMLCNEKNSFFYFIKSIFFYLIYFLIEMVILHNLWKGIKNYSNMSSNKKPYNTGLSQKTNDNADRNSMAVKTFMIILNGILFVFVLLWTIYKAKYKMPVFVTAYKEDNNTYPDKKLRYNCSEEDEDVDEYVKISKNSVIKTMAFSDMFNEKFIEQFEKRTQGMGKSSSLMEGFITKLGEYGKNISNKITEVGENAYGFKNKGDSEPKTPGILSNISSTIVDNPLTRGISDYTINPITKSISQGSKKLAEVAANVIVKR